MRYEVHMTTHYQHILFDLDGTIFNTEYTYMSTLLAVLKTLKPDTDETYESLIRFMGTTVRETKIALGLDEYDDEELTALWVNKLKDYERHIHPYEGVMGVIEYLYKKGIKLGIITSRTYDYNEVLDDIVSPHPTPLKPYFPYVICASDVKKPKPSGESILKYMEITGARREEILYIGDTEADFLCARDSGVDFGLAVWGSRVNHTLNCAHYFLNPWDIVGATFSVDSLNYQWYRWAKEIGGLSRIGLTYTTNDFDRERFTRLSDISMEILSTMSYEPLLKVKEVFALEKGYTTPKFDTRAAVFNAEGEILLVYEKQKNLWSLPGGWCDEAESLVSNTIKEVREEAGMIVRPIKLVGILDKSKWNTCNQPFHILSSFMICLAGEGALTDNLETSERRFFAFESLPVDRLRIHTSSYEQIKMCFEAYHSKNWVPVID